MGMALQNKDSITAFERKTAERLEVLIRERFKSVREFSRLAGIPYQRLNEIFNLRQHYRLVRGY
jgi:predicted transcriptional regulator